MTRKITLDVLSAGVTDALAETATLREQCKSQQQEIEGLNDYKLESEIEINCRISDESLIAAKQDMEILEAKQESFQQRIKNLEEEVLSYRKQIEKLVVVLRNKTRKALVASIAIKAAYKIVPSLKDQATIQRLQSLSEKATSPRWVEKDVDSMLKEAGVVVANETNNSLRTPALTPSRETTDDGERRRLKRKRHE
ncbi:uncharacterized protein NECHADRAFT_77544 [Fusarium vanettenii 77-13-4]|uniref:Uncharacterized protein n=1 Tax=Fusarium vanettenii (strain ATCC MYA-4622 / CBS 123669 / FGSC 9596 / NRRL 45880 / 77-13-4) TaxID=660122 RepID=C7YLI3_FUSV7|nr:uncharacterized protein NECHADRAFT_77544 [Fusarium vanettenii 77-13-4]EEU46788.1 hypothetical protein NECHADRAFT_77544 [Fusarium vanettenii 77-13-4]